MKTVLINKGGQDYLIRFEFFPETWDDDASIDIDEVMSHGRVIETSQEWNEQAEAQILAMYGKQLQDNAAESAAIEPDERAYR